MGQDRQKQQGHNVGDLDHRVHGGACRVLVGIADGVAGDGRLVGLRTLAAIVTFFDQLLGVVPGAAARGHRDGDEQAGDDHAHEHGAQGRKAVGLAGDLVDREEQDHGRNDRQQGRHDHFADGGRGQNADSASIFRLHFTGHDARIFTELTTDFFHHGFSSATNGGHGHTAEQEGQKAAEQQANHDIGVGKVEGDRTKAREE